MFVLPFMPVPLSKGFFQKLSIPQADVNISNPKRLDKKELDLLKFRLTKESDIASFPHSMICQPAICLLFLSLTSLRKKNNHHRYRAKANSFLPKKEFASG